MKQIFFKTVRRDGSSVRATGVLNRVYEIGKRYTFPEDLPAHVFAVKYPSGFSQLYWNRPEAQCGARLLICWGQVIARPVPIYPIWDMWVQTIGIATVRAFPTESRNTSMDFEVIGEIFMPPNVMGDEIPKPSALVI